MQPNSAHRLIETLGWCPVGTVWSAVTHQDRPVTVAVLSGVAASDQRWRAAFENAANSLARPQPGGPQILYADFAAATPWVACAADAGPGAERIFIALGMQYQPRPPAHDGPMSPVPATTSPANGAPAPEHAEDTQPTQRLELGSSAEPVRPFSAAPVSATPVSATPVSGPSMPTYEPSAQVSPPYPPRPGLLPPAYNRFQPQVPAGGPAKRRRTGRWIGITAAVVAVLVAAGGVAVWQLSGEEEPPPVATPTSAAPGTAPAALPTASPQFPGVEPPQDGAWPAAWPRFSATDNVQTYANLEGLGFTLKVPHNWQCVPGGRGEGFAKYNCGVSPGDTPDVGGEVVVRECPSGCPGERQTAMRGAEEAWGLQWIRVGEFASYAETSSLRIDDAERYGLIIVGYWRSGTTGTVDRQVVFRMTSPVDGAGQLRRVANYLRDTVVF